MIEAALERGEAPPRAVTNRPELWALGVPYWNAFQTLSPSRPVHGLGMAGARMGHILYSELSQYANDHDQAHTPGELDEFVYILQRMDSEFLEIVHSNLKAKTPPPKR